MLKGKLPVCMHCEFTRAARQAARMKTYAVRLALSWQTGIGEVSWQTGQYEYFPSHPCQVLVTVHSALGGFHADQGSHSYVPESRRVCTLANLPL